MSGKIGFRLFINPSGQKPYDLANLIREKVALRP
jgi:hypothetical protein